MYERPRIMIFRVYTSTALAAQDTGYTADTSAGDVNLQVRVRLQSTNAVAVAATDDWQLQWEKNTRHVDERRRWPNCSLDSYPDTNGSVNAAFSATTADASVGQSFLGNGQNLDPSRVLARRRSGHRRHCHGRPVTPTPERSGRAAYRPGRRWQPRPPRSTPRRSCVHAAWRTRSTSTARSRWRTAPRTSSVIEYDRRSATAGTCRHGQHVHRPIQVTRPTAARQCLDDALAYDLIFEVYTSPSSRRPPSSRYASANLTDGAATTNRLGAGTGSFVAGKVSEDGLVDDLGWTANNYTELLYSVTLKQADLAPTDTLRFRVLRNGATTGLTYTQVPTVTIGAAGPTDRTGTATGAITRRAVELGVRDTRGVATGALTVAGTASGARGGTASSAPPPAASPSAGTAASAPASPSRRPPPGRSRLPVQRRAGCRRSLSPAQPPVLSPSPVSPRVRRRSRLPRPARSPSPGWRPVSARWQGRHRRPHRHRRRDRGQIHQPAPPPERSPSAGPRRARSRSPPQPPAPSSSPAPPPGSMSSPAQPPASSPSRAQRPARRRSPAPPRASLTVAGTAPGRRGHRHRHRPDRRSPRPRSGRRQRRRHRHRHAHGLRDRDRGAGHRQPPPPARSPRRSLGSPQAEDRHRPATGTLTVTAVAVGTHGVTATATGSITITAQRPGPGSPSASKANGTTRR